jgi:hypothetical protein
LISVRLLSVHGERVLGEVPGRAAPEGR